MKTEEREELAKKISSYTTVSIEDVLNIINMSIDDIGINVDEEYIVGIIRLANVMRS